VARQKVKQEQIWLGLIEAPKAKVKVSNLMRVLGTEATADPLYVLERLYACDYRNQ